MGRRAQRRDRGEEGAALLGLGLGVRLGLALGLASGLGRRCVVEAKQALLGRCGYSPTPAFTRSLTLTPRPHAQPHPGQERVKAVEQIKEKYGPGLASAGRWAKVITEEVVKVSQ